jgi:hypothetical protein
MRSWEKLMPADIPDRVRTYTLEIEKHQKNALNNKSIVFFSREFRYKISFGGEYPHLVVDVFRQKTKRHSAF